MPRLAATLICALSLLAPASPAAHADDAGGDWHLSLEAGTDFPASLGLRASLEGPLRLRATLGVGYLPGGYVDVINAFEQEIGSYDQATADFIRQTIGDSIVVRATLGWRPFRKEGFYFELGYTFGGLGGGVTTQELVEAATGLALSDGASSSERTFDAAASLHLFVGEIGWEWLFLDDHLVLRASLGFLFTLGADSNVEAQFQPRFPNAVHQFEAASEAYIVDTFTSYVHAPAVNVQVGYRFF